MIGNFVILLAVGLAGLLIAAVALVVAFDDSSIVRRCARQARKLAALLDDRPDYVRSECVRIQRRLDRITEKQQRGKGLGAFPDGAKGLTAYADTEVLLAVLEHKGGNWTQAEARLARICSRFRSLEAYAPWLLRYFMLTGAANAEAVKLCAEMCSTSGQRAGPYSAEQLEAYLQRACTVEQGMSEEDLRARAQWNHLVQSVLKDRLWPWLGEAQAWYQLHSWARAQRVLETAIERFGNDQHARLLLARVLRAAGQTSRARFVLKQLASEMDGAPDILLGVADELLRIGDNAEAESVLERIDTTTGSLAAEVNGIRARALMRSGKPDEAIALLEQAGSVENDGDTGVLLAQLYSTRGEHKQAVAALHASVASNSRRPDHLWALATAHWNAEDYAEAGRFFGECRNVGYRGVEATLYYSRCLARCGRREEAADALETIPDNNHAVAAEAAFYRGTTLYSEGAPDRAFPYFVRAQKLAQQAGDRALAKRAGNNGVACYHAMVEQKIAAGDYAQAAKVIERLRGYHKHDADAQEMLSDAQAQCYIREAIAHLNNQQDADFHGAGTLVERSLDVRPDGRIRALLAGIYARQKRFSDALATYDAILSERPKSATARFGRALCLAQVDRAQGLAELRQLASQSGPFAVRSALAVAHMEADDGRYAEAADLLGEVLEQPGAAEDHFAGEARCQTVLFTLRAGNVEKARKLARRLMGGGQVNADAVLGTLLAHDGAYEDALGYLESGLPSDGKHTTGAVILNGVYRRVADAKCQEGDYQAASELLSRAAARDTDPALRQLAELVEMTIQAGRGKVDVDDRTVNMLLEALRSTSAPDPLLIRAAIVAQQMLARRKSQASQHQAASILWEYAFTLCRYLQGNDAFWQEYLASYNAGKQYTLDCTTEEIQQRIFQRLAGMHVLVLREILWESRTARTNGYQYALWHWNAAKSLVGAGAALELFEEIVEVDQLIRQVDPKSHPEDACTLLEWVYNNIEQKEEYKTAIGNISLESAIAALRRQEISDFLSRLDSAARFDSQMRDIARQVRGLGNRMIREIVRQTDRSPVGLAVKTARPDLYGQILLRVVVVFAGASLPYGFGPEHLHLVLDNVLMAVVKDMGS